mgnify:CR=1 FL=1
MVIAAARGTEATQAFAERALVSIRGTFKKDEHEGGTMFNSVKRQGWPLSLSSA